MKKIVILISAVLLLFVQNTNAQEQLDEWKERNEFYTILKTVMQSAKDGNSDQLINYLPEMNEKFSLFYKSIDEKFQGKNKEIKRYQTLLSEKKSFINSIVKAKTYNSEILYGELIGIFNLFHKILLKGEDANTTKEILKFYLKEEKKFEERKRIIQKENNWRLYSN